VEGSEALCLSIQWLRRHGMLIICWQDCGDLCARFEKKSH
jgi:hypothetical protein